MPKLNTTLDATMTAAEARLCRWLSYGDIAEDYFYNLGLKKEWVVELVAAAKVVKNRLDGHEPAICRAVKDCSRWHVRRKQPIFRPRQTPIL
jgi:hypothetical protein